MLKSVEGVYKDGAVQIFEKPSEIQEARVIVTFLPTGGCIDLAARGIDEAHAADLRARLRAFTNDWERPDMEAYDRVIGAYPEMPRVDAALRHTLGV